LEEETRAACRQAAVRNEDIMVGAPIFDLSDEKSREVTVADFSFMSVIDGTNIREEFSCFRQP
jgi:hypothetical protein